MRIKNYFTKENLNRLTQLTALTVFTIGSMVYYRSAEEEMPEVYRDSFLPWLLPIAVFAGLNEALEVYDHIAPAAENETPELAHPSSIDAVKMSIGAMLAPPLIACAGAHLLQGAALASSLHAEQDSIQNFMALCLSVPALSKFLLMTVPHVAHTINGTREQFSLSVTNNEIPQLIQRSMPSVKWCLAFVAMVWVHLSEGELIASPIENALFKTLAIYGFALAESLPHINQLEQIRSNININRFKQLTSLQLAMTFFVGALAGLVHSSQTILAVMATSDVNTPLHDMVLPIAFEFGIGVAEGIQHGVPAAERAGRFMQQRFIGKKPLAIACSNQENTERQTAPKLS